MAKVKLDTVTKKFREVVAVDRVSIEVEDGEFMALLGPSGCGKTTTLRLIAGLEEADEGSIHIGDVLVNNLPPSERDLSMVFQFYAMYPGMNAYNQLAFPLRMRKVPRNEIDRLVKEAAQTLGITDILDRPLRALTVDQKQRVAIGRAIVRKPKVFLFDEPLTNLDAQLRTTMRAELKHLQKKLGVTTIFVTHDQLEAITMADRIAVMNDGKIVQIGTTDDLYDNPANLFVAGFIGSPPMNFIDCTLSKRDGKIILEAGDFKYPSKKLNDLLKDQADGSKIVLGIRPEYIDVSKIQNGRTIQGSIEIVEPVGNRMILDMDIGGHPVKADVRAFDISSGDKVWVSFDEDKVRVFDKSSSNALV
jgi:multiple sugar transport system ATP-binding protein